MYDRRRPEALPLYAELLQGLKAIAERTILTEMEMATLAKNFAIKIPHCPLALYAKVEPPRRGRGRDARANARFTGGRPRGLYWGRVTRTHIVIHRKGRLNGGMIWKIALRGSKAPIFWAFERERVRLNRTHSLLSKAREDLRKMLLPFSAKPLPVAFETLASDLAPLAARDYPLVKGLYSLAHDAARIQTDVAALIQDFRRCAQAAPINLVSWQVDARFGNRRLYFTIGRRHLRPERLTLRLVRTLRLDPDLYGKIPLFRRKAADLNRDLSFVRLRLARARRIFRRAQLPIYVRRRRRRKEAAAS